MAAKALDSLVIAIEQLDQPRVQAALGVLERHGGYAAAMRNVSLARQPAISALHLAASRGYSKLLDMLLLSTPRGDPALDTRAAGDADCTAYIAACAAGHAAVVRRLAEHGCNTDLVDHRGCTGWDRAHATGHLEVLGVLRDLAQLEGHPSLRAELRRRRQRLHPNARSTEPEPEPEPQPEPQPEERAPELPIAEGQPPRGRPPELNRPRGGSQSPLRLKCNHPGCAEAWRLWPTREMLQYHKQSMHGIGYESPTVGGSTQQQVVRTKQRAYQCSRPGCGEMCHNWLTLESHVFHVHGVEALAAHVQSREKDHRVEAETERHEVGELCTFMRHEPAWQGLDPRHFQPQPSIVTRREPRKMSTPLHRGVYNTTGFVFSRDATSMAHVRLALAMCFNQSDHGDWLTDEDVAVMIAHYINKLVVCFTRAGANVEITGNNTRTCSNIAQVSRCGSFTGRCAICEYVMRTGVHYISMTLRQSAAIDDRHPRSLAWRPKGLAIGVVTSDYDPAGSRQVSAHESATGGAWLYAPVNGNLIHQNRGISWSGQQPAAVGDTIGLRLDLEHGSIDVWKNEEWIGTMVNCSPSLQRQPTDYQRDSSPAQPLYWCCDLGWEASSVEITWHR